MTIVILMGREGWQALYSFVGRNVVLSKAELWLFFELASAVFSQLVNLLNPRGVGKRSLFAYRG